MFQLRPLPRTLKAALRDAVDPKVAVRKSALTDLSRLADGDDRALVLEALGERLSKDESAEVRAAAALALADAEARGDLEALLGACADAHAAVRQMAVLALGELAPRCHREALSAVERAFEAAEGALRFQALLAASKLLGEGELDGWVARGIADADDRVRYLALRLLDQRLGETEQSVGSLSEELRRHCRDALNDVHFDVQVAAAFILGREADDRARGILVDALNRGVKLSAPEDEQELYELAGELRLVGAEPGLTRHAWGWFGLVPGKFAFQAKVALARLGNPRAQREILKGLSSWDRDTRTLSVVAAGRAGMTAAKERLQEMSRDSTVDANVIRTALREIG